MDEPREKTKQEVVDEFLTHIRALVTYWEKEDRQPDIRGKLEGLAFSILVMLDGGAMSICGFDLMPSFHPDDPEYLKINGQNWYPISIINDEIQLHELFAQND